jgi:hypothetical protein
MKNLILILATLFTLGSAQAMACSCVNISGNPQSESARKFLASKRGISLTRPHHPRSWVSLLRIWKRNGISKWISRFWKNS